MKIDKLNAFLDENLPDAKIEKGMTQGEVDIAWDANRKISDFGDKLREFFKSLDEEYREN